MGITIKIVSQNTETNECHVEVSDNNEVVSDVNIYLELNPDGSANTADILYKGKQIAFNKRQKKEADSKIVSVSRNV